MNTIPRLEVLVAENNRLLVQKIYNNDQSARQILSVSVEELGADGFDKSARKIGGLMLGIIKVWHPELFSPVDAPIDKSEWHKDDYAIATYLIARSMTENVCLSDTIEFLLSTSEEHNPSAKDFKEFAWPALKERIKMFKKLKEFSD